MDRSQDVNYGYDHLLNTEKLEEIPEDLMSILTQDLVGANTGQPSERFTDIVTPEELQIFFNNLVPKNTRSQNNWAIMCLKHGYMEKWESWDMCTVALTL